MNHDYLVRDTMLDFSAEEADNLDDLSVLLSGWTGSVVGAVSSRIDYHTGAGPGLLRRLLGVQGRGLDSSDVY